MLRKIIVIYLFFALLNSQAQQQFKILINPELTKNASALIHDKAVELNLINQRKLIYHYKASITVFNESAAHYGDLLMKYDKNNIVKKVEMLYYDANGKVIKKVKKKDFEDYSASHGYTLYTDDRYLYYNYIPVTYPFTVAIDFTIEKKNTAHIPSWTPINAYNCGVNKSSYTLQYPSDIHIKHIEKNFEGFAIEKTVKPGIFKYSIEKIPPYDREALRPDITEITPGVYFASDKFHLAGVDGIADNWNEFGQWYYDELLAPQTELPEEAKANIRNLVKNVLDPVEKAKLVYEYVQNKTRYINIAIGIGGWQPMSAKEVDQKAYGDCKALTNYTMALMHEVEVPAIYTVVNAGDDHKENILKDLSSIQGNHAFLCLPMEKDTIWLECTSQKVPFGTYNSFTDDRDVLLITPEGGKIVHTATNPPEANLQTTKGQFNIFSDGKLSGKVDIICRGTKHDQHLSYFDGLSPEKLDRAMKKYYNEINNLTFSKIEINNNKVDKQYEEHMVFEAENYAVSNPDQAMIINLNTFNRINYIPDRIIDRKLPFEILRGYKIEDNYTIQIPVNYRIESLPAPITIKNEFGTYELTISQIDDHSIKYNRSLLINKGYYPKEKYKDYRKFRKKIQKIENIKMIILKK